MNAVDDDDDDDDVDVDVDDVESNSDSFISTPYIHLHLISKPFNHHIHTTHNIIDMKLFSSLILTTKPDPR